MSDPIRPPLLQPLPLWQTDESANWVERESPAQAQPAPAAISTSSAPSGALQGVCRAPHSVSLAAIKPPGIAVLRPGSGLDVQPPCDAQYAAKDVMFIGDSQSVETQAGIRRTHAELTQKDSGLDFHSLGGRTTGDFLEWMKTPEAKERIQARDLVIVQLGGNDLSQNHGATQIVTNLRRIVQRIHAFNPKAKVVISTIPVRLHWLDATRPNVANKIQRRLDAVNRFIMAGGDAATRFGSLDVNKVIARCDARGAARIEQTCDTGYLNDQRPEFRRTYMDVHLNDAAYDAVGEAFVRLYVKPSK